MKIFSLSLLFLMLTGSLSFAQVKFEKLPLAEALKKAQSEGKMVFVDVYTTWCGPCKRLDKYVFSQPEVGEKMSKMFVALKVDNERSPERKNIQKYGIKAYPSMLVLEASSGKLIKKMEGYHSPRHFLDELNQLLPEDQWPENLAYQAILKHPDDAQVWKKSLPIIGAKNYRRADSLCQAYVDRFGLNEIKDEVDETIFRTSLLPLSSPLVQELLKKDLDDEHPQGLFYYFQYSEIAMLEQYQKTSSKKERRDLRRKAEALQARAWGMEYGFSEEFYDTFLKK